MPFFEIATLLVLAASSLARAEPLVTAAGQLAPRATDPGFVGYVSQSGGFGDARSCDYPQTLSTSGSYVQCCPTTGACPFYTACSSNTLLAGSVTVACDVNAALMCNTAIVLPTAGAQGGASYLACWQRTLGAAAFTMVQNVGSASVTGPAATGTSGAGSSSGSSASRSSSGASSSGATQTSSRASGSSSSSASASAASSSAGAAGVDNGLAGGLAGAVVLLAQMLL